MDRQWIVNRQGRDFVLYAGLLDEAHKQGLKWVSTSVVQAPTPENGYLAICHATVQTDRGTFEGIGDASPENVGRMIAPHIVRMAETRAKARALRDAVNVQASLLDDPEEDGEVPAPRAAPSPAAAPAPAPKPTYQTAHDAARWVHDHAWGIMLEPPETDDPDKLQGFIDHLRSEYRRFTDPGEAATPQQKRKIAALAQGLGLHLEEPCPLSAYGASLLINQLAQTTFAKEKQELPL